MSKDTKLRQKIKDNDSQTNSLKSYSTLQIEKSVLQKIYVVQYTSTYYLLDEMISATSYAKIYIISKIMYQIDVGDFTNNDISLGQINDFSPTGTLWVFKVYIVVLLIY